MINIKRVDKKSKLSALSEHSFEIAAGLFVILILGLGIYIGVRVNNNPNRSGSVAGIETSRVEETKTTLINTVAQNSNYKYFFDALTKTGLFETLRDPSKTYTVFIPNDDAFEAIGNMERSRIFDSPELLKKLVENHIIEGELKQSDFRRVAFMRSLNGNYITINRDEFGTLINQAPLMSHGYQADNGVGYEISKLLY